MQTVALARNAMATRFEVVLHGGNAAGLRAAGEEALNEIDRIEAQLSLYRPTSEISHVNARAAREPVRVTPAVFKFLQHARRLHDETRGLFDLTIAPLVRCWGFMGGTGQLPTAEQVAEARARVGMHLVELDEDNLAVRFARDGVSLDAGAIGKGYALDRAVELLREAGVASALIHGGTSTVYGLGQPPDAEFWNVAVEYPKAPGVRAKFSATVSLRDESVSVSAVWGRSFDAGGQTFGHVLDPRTGYPVTGTVLSAVALPSALETDALSTALLVAGESGHDGIAALRPRMRTVVITGCAGEPGFRATGRGMPNHI